MKFLRDGLFRRASPFEEATPAGADSRILFVHIPKTAGMSLYHALAGAVGEQRAIRFADGSKENREKYMAMSDAEVRQKALVSGHFPLQFFLKKPLSDYSVITVVRDAVDRELSAYFYVKTWTGHPRHEIVGKLNLYEFLDRRESDAKPNRQCAILGGTATFAAARKAIDKHRILAAPVEYINEFGKILEKRFGFGPLVLNRENTTKFRISVDELHPDIKRRFEALTQEDQRLYEYVKKQFETNVLGR